MSKAYNQMREEKICGAQTGAHKEEILLGINKVGYKEG